MSITSSPLSPSGVPVPLLCVTLSSSPSGWRPGPSPWTAGAPHADGSSALTLRQQRIQQIQHKQEKVVLAGDQPLKVCTCPGLGLVAGLFVRTGGSGCVMVLSLLARSSGWLISDGRGSVWELSLRLETYFGDSKKGTKGRRRNYLDRGHLKKAGVKRDAYLCPNLYGS